MYAKENKEDKKYRLFLHTFPSSTCFDTGAFYDRGDVVAGWSCSLTFSIAERNPDSENQGWERSGCLNEGEKPVWGVDWETVLPDGTIKKADEVYMDLDLKHTSADEAEREKWKLECARFRIPLEMVGTMTIRASVDGTVVGEYEITVVDTDSMYGTPIRGWIWSCCERYFIKDDGKLARGWFHNDGNWYYLNEDGVLQTGWQYVSYKGKKNWYYFSTKVSNLGSMRRGWQKIDDRWYYLKKDGTLASNEWYQGYWVGVDGSWKYKPKGSWKRDKNGWWFGDTSGWYAKNERMKINGIWYTFDNEGYLVE